MMQRRTQKMASDQLKLRRSLANASTQALEFRYNTAKDNDPLFVHELIRRMSLDLAASRRLKTSVKGALKGERERQDLLRRTIQRRIRCMRHLAPESVISVCNMIDELWGNHGKT